MSAAGWAGTVCAVLVSLGVVGGGLLWLHRLLSSVESNAAATARLAAAVERWSGRMEAGFLDHERRITRLGG